MALDTEDYQSKMPQRMLTVKEVASILHIHPNTLRRWQKQGLLKSYSIGSRHCLRLKPEDILDFLDKSQTKSPVNLRLNSDTERS